MSGEDLSVSYLFVHISKDVTESIDFLFGGTGWFVILCLLKERWG